jgi:RNA polymerase sigma-70 factor, ECF subfamily
LLTAPRPRLRLVTGTITRVPPRDTAAELDAESDQWIQALIGPDRDAAAARLHKLLLPIARSEIRRRQTSGEITGPEVDDLAHQAADDAVLAVMRRAHEFRGESRFTTWAFKFVVFEVSTKLGRHFWKRAGAPSGDADWDHVPDRFGIPPAEQVEARELVLALRRAVDTCLTAQQRAVFVAIIVQGQPLDGLVAEMGTNRNAVYKMMFDARRKLRRELVTQGYLDRDPPNPPEAA